MMWLKNKYDRIFFLFLLSILVVFPVSTNINNGLIKYISGDGVGYYAYLPAKYIYNDTAYEFKWFNQAYYSNYNYDSFGANNKEFFVPYKNRTINKYYQGQSFLWLPFFWTAHLAAKIFHYPADGFSYPYQLAIAFAALFYLALGLVFLRRLLLRLFHNELGALIIPIAVFYGTHLFVYLLYHSSYSHVYSFTFITLFIYFAHSFFNSPARQWSALLWALFWFVAIVCIRPLNGLVLLTLPAFIPAGFFKVHLRGVRLRLIDLVPLLLMVAILINQFSVLYKQTGTLLPYTYTNERFDFAHPKLFFVLFSYSMGLFVYMPLLVLAMTGIFFLPSTRQKLLLPLTFFIVIYLYSAWWYWSITSRALIDFYALMAIFLGALFKRVEHLPKTKIILVLLLLMTTAYFQLKFMQVKRGILDSNYTHSKLFWHNFFRTRNANTYAVPPPIIIKRLQFTEDFETGSYTGTKSGDKKFGGQYSGVLNDHADYTRVFEYKLPTFFKEKGGKKIRFSFYGYFLKDVKNIQLAMNLYDKNNDLIRATPVYLKEGNMTYDAWDLNEFGIEVEDDEVNSRQADHVSVYLWNPELKNALFIDNVKTEFILTGEHYETFAGFFQKLFHL